MTGAARGTFNERTLGLNQSYVMHSICIAYIRADKGWRPKHSLLHYQHRDHHDEGFMGLKSTSKLSSPCRFVLAAFGSKADARDARSDARFRPEAVGAAKLVYQLI